MTTKNARPIGGHEMRRLCVEACCCEPTAERYFGGQTIKGTSKARIERALRKLGRGDLIRQEVAQTG